MPNHNPILFYIFVVFHILLYILNFDIFLINLVTRSRATSVESLKGDVPKKGTQSKKLKDIAQSGK